jgi:hypothetical protein
MQPEEKRVVLLLADISGYTRFMVRNQTSAVHGQVAITHMLETLLREVDIPLQLQEIEGDAVFLSAPHPGSEEGWQRVLAEVRTKLLRFFEVFFQGLVTLQESTECPCDVCAHIDELSLKIVVHSGKAVFFSIGDRPQISGVDVILAHRLLKNSVPSHEYLLLSEAAYRELGADVMGLDFARSSEVYDEFGTVGTRVHLLGEESDRARAELYAMTPDGLSSRARWYGREMLRGQLAALLLHLRRPVVGTSLPGRILFTLGTIAMMPVFFFRVLTSTPGRLLARQAERKAAVAERVA